jgi:hypothetical protein
MYVYKVYLLSILVPMRACTALCMDKIWHNTYVTCRTSMCSSKTHAHARVQSQIERYTAVRRARALKNVNKYAHKPLIMSEHYAAHHTRQLLCEPCTRIRTILERTLKHYASAHKVVALSETVTGAGGLRDTWYANTSSYPITWNKSATVLPQPLYGHAMAITDSGLIWISAGRVSATRFTNVLLSMNVSSLYENKGEPWLQLAASRRSDGAGLPRVQSGDVPSERWNHNMVAVRKTLWLMGGLAPDGSISDGDMYVLDTASELLKWKKKTLTSALAPEPRHSFGMAAAGNVIYVRNLLFLAKFNHIDIRRVLHFWFVCSLAACLVHAYVYELM